MEAVTTADREFITYQDDDDVLFAKASVLDDGRLQVETDVGQWTFSLADSHAIASWMLTLMEDR